MTKVLITADFHLTSNAKDEYRWDIFNWIRKQIARRGISEVLILGDLTDKKDNHPSTLVNRVVKELVVLANDLDALHILKGNHDYLGSEGPFFQFMDLFAEEHGIYFYNEITRMIVGGEPCVFVPNMPAIPKDFSFDKVVKKTGAKVVFTHFCFEGSISSSGKSLVGATPGQDTPFRIISGDIHKPQDVGNVTYTGSPHPVDFGDDFKPRVLLMEGKNITSISRSTVRKLTIELSSLSKVEEIEIEEGDMVRFTYHNVKEKVDAELCQEINKTLRTYCSKNKAEFKGVTIRVSDASLESSEELKSMDHGDIVREYCKEKKIGDHDLKIGLELVK